MRPDPVCTAVRIAVQLWDAALDGLARLGKRPEGPLVRGKLDHPVEPELALDFLDRLPGS